MTILAFSMDLAISLSDSRDQFPVDFNDAWQWLGYTRKDNALRALLNFRFVENVDFIYLLNPEELRQSGNPSDVIRLTTECFKQWGMMAGTLQGKEIRMYFLECERIAKEQNANLTESELILRSAQRLVDLERQELRNKAHFDALDRSRDEHDNRLDGVEAEVGRYKNGHGEWYTAVGYSKIKKIYPPPSKDQLKSFGKAASKLCREQGIVIQKVYDTIYGEINCYPTCILDQVPWSAR